MMPVEFDVTGKVVFITGAGRGIGKGIAQVLAESGADIALNALTPKYVEGTAAEIAASSGRRVVPMIADVTKADEVRRAVDTILATFGHIDVLVNALGDSIRKPLVTLPGKEDGTAGVSDDELRFIMDINLTEALLCTRALGPHMLQRRSGAIVNVSSVAAIRYTGYPYVAYYAAKAAVNNFTMGLALQYAKDGIRVNAVMPGLMNTPLIFQQISGQYKDAAEMLKARDAACPMDAWGRPGTSQRLLCSWLRTRHNTSQASACRLTEA